MFESITVIAGLDDVAVMRPSIQQSGGHLGVTKNRWPFGKAQIGGNDLTGVFV